MEITLNDFLRDYAQPEYRVDGHKLMRRAELETCILRDLDQEDEVHIDTRHDGSLIAVAGADSHVPAKIWVIEGLENKHAVPVDTLSEIQTDEDGTTTAVTRGGRQIIISPEWDVWSDSAGGFDGWFGVNVCLDGNDYTYCPDWAGDASNELRIVDFICHGFFAACIRDDYKPGEYKDVDEYLCSGWPWAAIQGWFDTALSAALESAERAYREKAERITTEDEEE